MTHTIENGYYNDLCGDFVKFAQRCNLGDKIFYTEGQSHKDGIIVGVNYRGANIQGTSGRYFCKWVNVQKIIKA